jgi:hypothetical protein
MSSIHRRASKCCTDRRLRRCTPLDTYLHNLRYYLCLRAIDYIQRRNACAYTALEYEAELASRRLNDIPCLTLALLLECVEEDRHIPPQPTEAGSRHRVEIDLASGWQHVAGGEEGAAAREAL